ncbi:MAG: S-methyl-5'-thioadenosine phosphorylase [Candidatus Tectomicrobia bacterium]|nr:S-methyl-5'-thioadenosine phosphorylase [Candidatus Tectomicrobia bacterium]
MPDLTDVEEAALDTPFGPPSDSYLLGNLGGRPMAFLARHGRGHVLAPTEVNFRANLYGMKLLGVERVLSISAVGSMREEIHPGDIVFPDQFIDRTTRRAATFFGGGIVAHVPMAHPTCPEVHRTYVEAAGQMGLAFHAGGAYVCIEGPQFSTRAESSLYRSWGVSVIGMTNATEAKLAREAEICYGTIALVTDYDCWHEDEERHVSTEAVVAILHRNVERARQIIREVVARLPRERRCGCGRALEGAVITSPDRIPAGVKERLKPLIGKYVR